MSSSPHEQMVSDSEMPATTEPVTETKTDSPHIELEVGKEAGDTRPTTITELHHDDHIMKLLRERMQFGGSTEDLFGKIKDVFEPNGQMTEDYYNRRSDTGTRCGRFVQIAVVPILILFILNRVTGDGVGASYHFMSVLVGIGVALMFTVYFVHLATQLWVWYPNKGCPCFKIRDDRHLYRIKTPCLNVNDWSKMRIAVKYNEKPWHPIASISEFSAIAGGMANKMISNLGPMVWVVVTMLFASEMQCRDADQFKMELSDYFIVIGVLGIVMIGLFELDSDRWELVAGHYLGVLLAIFILIASVIQANESGGGVYYVVPIILNAIAWPCFIYWQYISDEMETNKWFEREIMKRNYNKNCCDFVRDKRDCFCPPRPCRKNDESKDDEKKKELTLEFQKNWAKAKAIKSEDEKKLSAEATKEEIEEAKNKTTKLRQNEKKKLLSAEAMKEITKHSVKCIVYEGLAIWCTQMALAYYLIIWDEN